MDIYSVESETPSLDEADPLDDLEEFAVTLAHLSDLRLTGDENGKCDEKDEIFFTQTGNAGTIDFCLYLCDIAVYHAFTHSVSPRIHSRYSCPTFHGLDVDTCCAFVSTCGLEQYKAYCVFVGRKLTFRKHKSST